MELWMFILFVLPIIVSPITVSSNGNSPETKMTGGMLVDLQNAEADPKLVANKTGHQAYNIPKLAINERYRRLIPYMTFYYANDEVSSVTKQPENVEVEKAAILESSTDRPSEREPKLIYKTQRPKSIPRYNGNRLTQFNIASSNPTKVFYKEIPVFYHNPSKPISNYNIPRLEVEQFGSRDVSFDYYVPKQIKAPSAPFTVPERKPSSNFYQHEDFSPNVQYYSSDQEGAPKYKLIPYEQTPPIKVVDASKKYYNSPAVATKESVYIKSRPILSPQTFYETHNGQQLPQQTRKPATISEIYYEKQPTSTIVEPLVEGGFKPIYKNTAVTEDPVYTSAVQEEELQYHNYQDENQKVANANTNSNRPWDNSHRQYYITEQHVPKQKEESSNSVTLAELLNSLQINKSIPKPITRENVGDSIRTLLNVLSTLKAFPVQNEAAVAVISTPKPFEPSEISVATPLNSLSSTTPKPEEQDLHEESYLAPIHTPSQYLDDYPTGSVGSTQRFPLPVTSDEEGGTPGRPGIDYPILTVIPTTKFNCKTQRYKGFFADTETRCQVWHYCDLNGGQASFLCPNGTIFSQAALTCDWWFNVRCASTAQLYVLNESLYKYILPHSPKFPEDYSGPLVDKYLSLKFKEMEEQFKKNKKKTTEKVDPDDVNGSTENNSSAENSTTSEKYNESTVNRADVIIETPGSSGNVQRLQDE